MTWFERHTGHALYRARDGMFLGVCKGLADYWGLRVGWVRVGVVLLTVVTSFTPIFIAYVVLALVLKPAPVLRPATNGDWAFYDAYAASRSTAVSELKRRFDELDRRTRRMEDVVTARGFDWNERLRGHRC